MIAGALVRLRGGIGTVLTGARGRWACCDWPVKALFRPFPSP